MQLSVVFFFFLADFSLSTEDEVAQRGNPDDGRSGIVFHAVVHFMEAANKKCCCLLQVTSGSLSGSK